MKRALPLGVTIAGLSALAACVSAPAPPAPPPPEPAPAQTPAPPPPPPPASWVDGTLTAGDWRYVESPNPRATFGEGAPVLTIACTADRQIRFVRAGALSGEAIMAIRTTAVDRSLPATAGPEGIVAMLAPADPLLDQIAFSRGRILVQVAGQADLVLPNWPEPARVIEECRGQ